MTRRKTSRELAPALPASEVGAEAVAGVPSGLGPAVKLASALLVVLLVVVPLVFWPGLREAFRLPKAVLGFALALAAAAVLAVGFAWRPAGAPTRRPGVVRLVLGAAMCLVLVAALGSFWTEHPERLGGALLALAAGVVVLTSLSCYMSRPLLARILEWSVVSGLVLAAVAMAQALDWYQPFSFSATPMSGREGVTSLAGNPGDLATFLVLPLLVALARVFGSGPRRGWWAGATLLLAAGLLASQTFAALLAAAVAVVFLAGMTVGLRRALVASALVAVVAAAVAAGWAPLRERVLEKSRAVADGDINDLLTGRLDGWRTAIEMGHSAPWTGVGLGGFGAEFATTRLALMDRGVVFYERHNFSSFSNAHSDPLELFAELGVPGVIVALVGLLAALAAARLALEDPDSRVALAYLLSMAIVWWFAFPFHLAITAWPTLIALAAVLAEPRQASEVAVA